MVGPFAKIQDQINFFFPPETHPYRFLESRIERNIHEAATVLDIGCGHGAPILQKLGGRAGKLYGIDLITFDQPCDGTGDDRLTLINEDVSDLKSFSDCSIDVAYSRSVMEHVQDMEGAYREIARVLKPSGRYIFLTPNRYDYASILATIVPSRFHGPVVRVTEGRSEIDTFPTCYLSNSFRDIRRLARAHGLRVVELSRLEQYPAYLSFSRPLFWLGCLYEKMIGALPGLHVLKGWIFCVLEKPSEP